MPDPHPTPRRTLRPLAIAFAVIVFVTVGVFGVSWVAPGDATGAEANAATSERTAHPAQDTQPAQPTSLASAHSASTAAAADARPPGRLSAAQWRTISDRIEPGPGHDSELARIASLLAFQDNVARLRELRDDPAAAEERRRLAREIDAGIGLHLARREATGPEALQLKTAVLAELEPDAAARLAQLQAFRQRISAENPPAIDSRVAAYQRQEAAIVAEWQSGSASQRDPAVLARRLQQLQVAVFDEGGR